MNFAYEVNKLKKSLAIKADKTGWFSYSNEFFKKITELAKILGISEQDGIFFELSEDNSFMRFNPDYFQTAFLRACKRKGKIFDKQAWNETVLEGDYKFSSFTLAKKFSWFEMPNGEVINWQDLEDPDPKILMGRFLAQLPLDRWDSVIYYSIKNLAAFIKTGSDLGKLLAQINEESKVKYIISNLCNFGHLDSIMNSKNSG